MLGDLGGSLLDSQTQKWNGLGDLTDPEEPLPEPLALASGLSANGLHIRAKGHTHWRWTPKGAESHVREDDCIAVLLESPPGSGNPGPQEDLLSSETICILGFEVRPL